MDTSGAPFGGFAVAAERQTGRYGDKPLLTWYDDGRGERVELSFKTFENWVAKTANLLAEELGAEPGDRVGVVLVDHWQTAVVLAACWRAGTSVVVLDPDDHGPGVLDPVVLDPSAGRPAAPPAPAGLAAAFVREEFLPGAAAALAGTPLVALTADLLGRGERDLGAALNFARVVPAMGDRFEEGADPAGAALTTGAGPATMAELLDRAAALTARTGLTDRDRALSGLPLLSAGGVAAGLLAPLTAGAGVVLARGFEPERFWKRAADERVAVAALDPDQVAALLAAGPPAAGLDRSRLRAVACDGAEAGLAAGFATAFGVPLT